MDQGHREYTGYIFRECLEFPAGGSYPEILQTPDAHCLYAQLSFIRPKTLGVSSGQHPLPLRCISPCISVHPEVAG